MPAPADCHPGGKTFPSPVVREMLRALGVTVCEKCHRVTRIATRRGVIER